MVAQYAKAPVEPFQFARNNKYPDALFQAELADAGNRCAMFRQKQYFNYTTAEIPATFGDGERKRWRFRLVASPYAKLVVFKASLAQAETESTSSRPRVVLTIADGAGVTQATAEIGFGAAATGGADPDDLMHGWTWAVNAAGTAFWEPTANTEYQATIADHDNGRVFCCSVYEIAINLDPPFGEGYAVGTPILDTDRQTLAAAARQMWKTQAAPLFHWTVDVAGSPRSYGSPNSTPKNVIDDAATTANASDPGFTIDLRNKARLSTGTVPVKMWAYGSSAGATGGTVKLIAPGGSTLLTISGIKTEGWYSTTGTLDDTLSKVDVHYNGDGTNTFTLHHVSLLQYATGS
jgi:hypothetical protein